jgi:HSP20 family protein
MTGDIVPFRANMPIWNSFSQLEREFDRFFETPFFSMVSENKRVFPKVNIKEDEKNYIVEVALPGYEKKDVDIEFKEGCLHIKSEQRKEINDEKDNYIHREISSRAFYRTIPFSEEVKSEEIKANYKNGMVEITLPKTKSKEKKIKKIEIE